MKYGCCVSVTDVLPVREGKNIGERLIQAGFDYVELPLAAISQLTEVEFAALKQSMKQIKCEACNVFLPQAVKIVGEHVDAVSFSSYLEHAVKRASELGAEVIVLGSSGSRNVPEGFSKEKAWEQLVAAFRIVSEKIKPYDITVVVEPLNKGESNIINSLPEGYDLVKDVDRDNIKLLADYYHMAVEGEDISHVEGCGDALRHIHFAEREGRVFPWEHKEEYVRFMQAIQKIGYEGRFSFECGTRGKNREQTLLDEAVKALEMLRD